jgi:hypothetical protein
VDLLVETLQLEKLTVVEDRVLFVLPLRFGGDGVTEVRA